MKLKQILKIISLPVEKEHIHFTSELNKILILWYENSFLDVQYLSAVV